jgi:hypothetical protein
MCGVVLLVERPWSALPACQLFAPIVLSGKLTILPSLDVDVSREEDRSGRSIESEARKGVVCVGIAVRIGLVRYVCLYSRSDC